MKTTTLSDGREIPIIGLGTHGIGTYLPDLDPEEITYQNIKEGARLIDTGTRYKNEERVGAGVKRALKEGIVKREELFIVGKVWLDGRKKPEIPLRKTLDCFGIDYIDLYLDHWPYGKEYRKGDIKDSFEAVPIYDSWKKMEDLVKKKLAKSIGVSNYSVQCLCNLLSFCKTRPVVNEVEFHPYYYQKNLKEFCDKENIKIIAYTPLVGGIVPRTWNIEHNNEFNVFNEQIFINLAKKYTKTSGQIILNWHTRLGVIPIPCTSKDWRMRENLNATKFTMEDEDFEAICNFALNGRKKKFVVGDKYFGVNILG